MNPTLTVRDIDPGDKSWLKREARSVGVSMEEFVRRIIHEKRVKAEQRAKPSEAFGRHFGRDHGVELPPRTRYRYEPVEFTDETGT
jgi:plasmid stability protein